MEKKLKIRFKANRPASALIMTIVLTVLLAIVAVMFVAVARMDRASTSNIADNKTLDLAAKSIVEIINKELVNDTPGVAGQEYYDYPDANNAWLASLQPYRHDANNYIWRQISDATGYLARRNFSRHDVNTVPQNSSSSTVVHDNPIRLDPNGRLQRQSADADGDGIADSWWIELEDTNWSMRSSKGQRIYAAVRVIDNGGMVNINTAHTFNPASIFDVNINGSSQMQINLKGLLKGTLAQINTQMTNFDNARCGSASRYWPNYERNVIWDYNNTPGGNYLPFDISDELELKYRCCIDGKFVSRFEVDLPYTSEGAGIRNFGNLYDELYPSSGQWCLNDWQRRVTDPNDPNTDRRHMLTTYNYDRVIEPNGTRMANINVADINTLYRKIHVTIPDGNMAAQIAVNIIDYRDNDSNVTPFNANSTTYYGFETQPFISEIAAIIDTTNPNGNSFYALELYNPFNVSVSLNNFILSIDNGTDISLSGTIDPDDYFVISNDLTKFTISTPRTQTDAALKFSGNYVDTDSDGTIDSWNNYNLTLKRTVGGSNIILDVQETNNVWFDPNSTIFYAQRDPNNWHIVYQTMSVNLTGNLGLKNGMSIAGNNYNLSLANENFVTIGDIARPLIIGPNTFPNGTIGQRLASAPSESFVRMDLANANNHPIFKYLTVMDPHNHISNANETRIKGRININTAPAYVIAQLPWVSQRRGGYNDPNLAKAIVAYRDKMQITGGPNYSNRSDANGFGSIGQLMNVIDPNINHRNYSIDYYSRDGTDQLVFPDLDPNDGAIDDFEERDLIFARISDLVTVRSDVFTAYILVRVGTSIEDTPSRRLVTGPQKRYMVIFDRSEVPFDHEGRPNDKVWIKAFQVVPEAR
jgi:hypothetical protein